MSVKIKNLKLTCNRSVTSKVHTNSSVTVPLPVTNQDKRTENVQDFVMISQEVHEMRCPMTSLLRIT